MKIDEIQIGFVGFGHMAQIICRALDKTRLIPRSKILFHRRDPAKALENEREFGITSTSLSNLVHRSSLILICVRPNQAEVVFQDLMKESLNSKMIVSIMAGIMIPAIKKFNPQMHVARAMPNVASEISRGMTLLSFEDKPALEFRSCVHLLFSSLGNIMEIPESLMDLGSAMAGSGPAFVLEMIEAMARHGEKEGFSYGKALTITAQTFLGAAELVLKGRLPEELISQIVVEGGTTIEGLKVLRMARIKNLLEAVLTASTERSKKLSQQFL